MTKEIALHCMKSASELKSELCEECPIYGQTGSDHCFEEALQYVIEMLEQEPCEDAISRQAVLEVLKDKWNMFSDANDAMQESIDTIEALSNVTPQPKTGHWIEEFNDLEGEVRFTCSSCGKYQLFGTDYCYNCGAKMIEPQESEDKE